MLHNQYNQTHHLSNLYIAKMFKIFISFIN
jgi:hypothetical protein